jgi:hypothetical protein
LVSTQQNSPQGGHFRDENYQRAFGCCGIRWNWRRPPRLNALCSFADRLGLGDSLSSAIPVRGERAPLHDRGKVLVYQMATIAGGGESCADIESEETLFGFVPSDSTAWRSFHEVTPKTRADLKTALATVREKTWARSSVTTGATRSSWASTPL